MGRQSEMTSLERMEELRGRIARWRSTPRRSKSMPAPLWADAVALAHALGVHRVHSVLGLNYASLRRRVDGASGGEREAAQTGFVELTGAHLLGVPAPGGTQSGGAVVEVSEPGGARMTVRVAEGGALDIAQLVAAFRSRSP